MLQQELTQELTQEQVNALFQQVCKEVSGIIPFSDRIKKEIIINQHKTNLGLCRRNPLFKTFTIYLSKYLLKCDIKLIKEVIIHELIHTCDNCFNHSYNFKYYMNKVNRMLGYNVTVRNRDKQFKEQIKSKYTIRCTKCGKEFTRNRINKHFTTIYSCKCGGKLLVEKNF